MEQNVARKLIFDNLMKLPHRNLKEVVEPFSEALIDDPYFTSRALVHLFDTSVIRDQKISAVITLLKSAPHYGLRDVGKALFGLDFYKTKNTSHLSALPPYLLLRIWGYMSGHTMFKGNKPVAQRRMRDIMTDYVDFMEAHEDRYDNVVLLKRKEIRELYLWLRRWPTPRYQFLVSHNTPPPAGSVFHMVGEIARLKDPVEKARLAIEFKLPYTVTSTLLPKKHAAAHVALIDRMTPTEAVNSVNWVEGSNILKIPEVKRAFLDKVAQAKNVSSMANRKSSQAKTSEVSKVIEKARDDTMKEAPKIILRTLLNVDRSTSMTGAIHFSKALVAYLGARFASPDLLYMVVSNDMAIKIKLDDLTLSEVEKKTALITANGATSMGVGVAKALNESFDPEQIITLTDGDENRQPRYKEAIRNLDESVNHIIIGMGDYHPHFHQELEARGLNVTFIPYESNDYYLFEQLGSLLAGQKRKSLVETILEIELPELIH